MAASVSVSFSDYVKESYLNPPLWHPTSCLCPNCTEILKVDVLDERQDLSVLRFKCGACKWNGLMSFSTYYFTNVPELVKKDIDKFLSIDVIEQTERELEREIIDEHFSF